MLPAGVPPDVPLLAGVPDDVPLLVGVLPDDAVVPPVEELVPDGVELPGAVVVSGGAGPEEAPPEPPEDVGGVVAGTLVAGTVVAGTVDVGTTAVDPGLVTTGRGRNRK